MNWNEMQRSSLLIVFGASLLVLAFRPFGKPADSAESPLPPRPAQAATQAAARPFIQVASADPALIPEIAPKLAASLAAAPEALAIAPERVEEAAAPLAAPLAESLPLPPALTYPELARPLAEASESWPADPEPAHVATTPALPSARTLALLSNPRFSPARILDEDEDGAEEEPALFAESPPAGEDGAEIETASLFTGSVRKKPVPLTILQIGDSHTAADYFTHAVRRALQERHGNGGPGYMEIGSPHAGVRSSNLTVSASSGWSYAGIQRSATPEAFTLAGFQASTRREGETVSFASEGRVVYNLIEIEALTGPDEGAIEVELDGKPVLSRSLQAAERRQEVLEIRAPKKLASFGRLVVRTTQARPVTISSVGIYRTDSGVSYSNIGFPGATVDILNKFPQGTVTSALQRLNPNIVVLAFGTNEGFNDNLDLPSYREKYRAVIRTIREGAPKAQIVMVGPSFANRVSAAQANRAAETKTAEAKPADAKPAEGMEAAAPAPAEAEPAVEKASDKSSCPMVTPPQLDRVRDLQRRLADEEGIKFWDWSAIMPRNCGAHRWFTASPQLMSKDHVHFTKEGYKVSGRAFAGFIEPVARRLIRGGYAVSNN